MKMIYGSLSVRRRFGFGEILEKPVPVGAKRQKCGLSRRAIPESPMRCTPGISDVRRDEKAPYIGITILSQQIA